MDIMFMSFSTFSNFILFFVISICKFFKSYLEKHDINVYNTDTQHSTITVVLLKIPYLFI